MTKQRAKFDFRFTWLLAAAGALASCGGGGGGGGGFANGVDASGIWLGTIHIDFTTGDIPAVLIAQTNGKIHLDTDISLLIGTASTEANALTATADGYSYNAYFAGGLDFTLSGSVSGGNELTGAFTSSAQTGILHFDRNTTLSNMPASLGAITGTYDGSIWILDGAVETTIPIQANGDFEFTAMDCTVDGNVSVLDSVRNLYKWSARLSGECPTNGSASGVAFKFGPDAVYFVGRVGKAAVYFGGMTDSASVGTDAVSGAPSVSGVQRKDALEFLRSRMYPRSR